MPNKIEALEDGKKFHVELETGEVFDGDPLEITTKMAEAHVNTKRWGQEWKTKAEAPPPPPAVVPAVPAANAEEIQLQSYLGNQTAKYLGLKDGEELKVSLAQMRQATERMQHAAVAADFMQICPDFPNDPRAIAAVMAKVEEMGYENRPQDLATAHMLCIREGKYQALTKDEQDQTSTRSNVPPMVKSGSPDANSTAFDPYKVPLNELRERVIREQLNGAS